MFIFEFKKLLQYLEQFFITELYTKIRTIKHLSC